MISQGCMQTETIQIKPIAHRLLPIGYCPSDQ